MFDWINNTISTATGIVQAATGLAVIIMFVVVAVKTRLAIASCLLAAVVGGFVIFAVSLNGLGWFSEGIKDTTVGLGANASISAEL